MEALLDAHGLVEALLFVSDEVLSEAQLADLCALSQTEIRKVLSDLTQDYERGNRGFVLREVAGGWRLFSHPAYADYIEKLVLSWDARRLSQAALETLAIIAYRQPVTRAQINAVRGVNSEAALSSLMEKGIVKEVGRDKTPGQPFLYGTTAKFLERFALRSLSELPPLEEFAPDDETRQQITDTFAGSVQRLAGLDAEATLDGEEGAPRGADGGGPGPDPRPEASADEEIQQVD